MSQNTTVEIVYDTRNNVALVAFKEGATAIDFASATRFILVLGSNIVDTAITATAITATATTGELKFDLGQLSLPVGNYAATLTVFDPVHPQGQVLACSDDKLLIFKVRSC